MSDFHAWPDNGGILHNCCCRGSSSKRPLRSWTSKRNTGYIMITHYTIEGLEGLKQTKSKAFWIWAQRFGWIYVLELTVFRLLCLQAPISRVSVLNPLLFGRIHRAHFISGRGFTGRRTSSSLLVSAYFVGRSDKRTISRLVIPLTVHVRSSPHGSPLAW